MPRRKYGRLQKSIQPTPVHKCGFCTAVSPEQRERCPAHSEQEREAYWSKRPRKTRRHRPKLIERRWKKNNPDED